MNGSRKIALGGALFGAVLFTAFMYGRLERAPDAEPAPVALVSSTTSLANPTTHEIPPNPAKWCTAKPIVPGMHVTTQIGNCPAPPPSSCPAGRIATTSVAWRYDGAGRKSMDVRQAANIFGTWTGIAPIVPFPWNNQFAVLWGFPRTAGAYIAAEFTVPAGFNPAAWGMFTKGETLPGPLIDFTISERCGDFSPAAQHCARLGVGVGARAGTWKLASAPVVAACVLQPGRTYYLNLRLTNPAADHHDCTGSACKVTIQHNRTP